MGHIMSLLAHEKMYIVRNVYLGSVRVSRKACNTRQCLELHIVHDQLSQS